MIKVLYVQRLENIMMGRHAVIFFCPSLIHLHIFVVAVFFFFFFWGGGVEHQHLVYNSRECEKYQRS